MRIDGLESPRVSQTSFFMRENQSFGKRKLTVLTLTAKVSLRKLSLSLPKNQDYENLCFIVGFLIVATNGHQKAARSTTRLGSNHASR